MIIILARVKVHAASKNDFVALAGKLVEASRTEPGCLGYELLAEEDGQFAFLERYVDEAAAAAHRKTDHFRTIGRALGPFVDGPVTAIKLLDLASLGQEAKA